MKIRMVPDGMLYRKARPVNTVDARIQGIIGRMFITMYQARGIGLAANQVGTLLQIVVLNIGHDPMVLINPAIQDMHSGRVWERESCLSIPGYSVPVERMYQIQVKSLNWQGKEQNFEAAGLTARCIQHEVDHLHGILINGE